MNKTIDHGLIESIKHYVIHGLHPGSCGKAIILGDYELAKGSAHILIRRMIDRYPEDDLIQNMIDWVNTTLPEFMRSTEENFNNWVDHAGLDGAEDEVRMFMKLNPIKNMEKWDLRSVWVEEGKKVV